MDGALHELDWVPLTNTSYIIKYVFCDSGYLVLLSNFTSVYEEEMRDTDIAKKFNNINSHVKMKPRVILENVKKSLEKYLVDQSDPSLKFDKNQVTITLSFRAASVLCKYDIEMKLMPADKVLQYIIAPTVLGAVLSQRKVLELHKKVTSVENAKSSVSETLSPQNAIDPDWLKGKNVPAQVICDSFLKLQSHFKDLSAENYEAYSLSRKTKSENASTAHSVSPLKKAKLIENSDESGINYLDEDDGHSLIKKEEEMKSNKPIELPRTAARKKKVLKI